MKDTDVPNIKKAMSPTQKRAKETYESLLKASQAILEEDGYEALNSNAIVERAGLTPPAFYRYFKDKQMILSVLAERLMDAQNELVEPRINEMSASRDNLPVIIEGLFHAHIKVSKDFQASFEIMVLMRALPSLRQIRLDSHDAMAQLLVTSVKSHRQPPSAARLTTRARLAVELFYSTLEMLFETRFKGQGDVIKQASRAVAAVVDDASHSRSP